MLRVARDPGAPPLSGAHQYGLERLIDLSRLVLLEGPGEVVELRVTGGAETLALPAAVESRWGITSRDGIVEVPRAVLALVTAVAGAEREHRSPYRDRHDRVPATENQLVVDHLEREPVLGRAAAAFR